eukprot:sb/3461945/
MASTSGEPPPPVDDEAVYSAVEDAVEPSTAATSRAESEEEEEDDDETEPTLKYERSIRNDLKDRIFPHTKITKVAVHEKFIVLGDIRGQVYLLDHSGTIIRQINAHKGAVTCLTIDLTGEYIASSSRYDQNLVIKGLYKESSERDSSEMFRQPVHSVELGPEFSSQGHYVIGTDRVILNEKGFFGSKRTSLHAGEGPIWTVKWRNTFIAWANDLGVKIYDTNSRKLITKIARDPKSPAPADYHCHICWYSGVSLLVGWANTIKICQVRPRTSSDSADLPPYYVEVMNIIYLDHYVSGIGAQPGDKIISLGYNPPDNNKKPIRPCVRITAFSGQELSLEELSIKGFESCKANDYNMSVLAVDHYVYISAPSDLIIAKPRDTTDKVEWLISKHRYEEALEIVKDGGVEKHTYKSVGQLYLAYLRDRGQFETCARLCKDIIGEDAEAWSREIVAFHNCKKLTILCQYIPIHKPRLDSWTYELALSSFLQLHEFKQFGEYLEKWPPEICGQKALINYLVGVVKEVKNTHPDYVYLFKCLALLYEYNEDYINSLFLYIKLDCDRAFDLIGRYNLFHSLEGDDRVYRLLKKNETKAIELFVQNTEKIPVSMVVKELKHKNELDKPTMIEKKKQYLYRYLDELFQSDPEAGDDYHGEMIALYAEYDTTKDKVKLMRFLKESTKYPIDRAYEICETRRLYEAQVYLLTKMGRSMKALSLLIDKLGDISAAIEFCKEEEDKELWDNLLKKATESRKPSFITGLLQNIGTHINPKDLIAWIPNGQRIEGLRDSLVKILQDYKLQVNLNEGYKRVFVNDTVTLGKNMRSMARRGTHIDESTTCQLCTNPLIQEHEAFLGDVTVFFCGHAYHNDTCLRGREFCVSCVKS